MIPCTLKTSKSVTIGLFREYFDANNISIQEFSNRIVYIHHYICAVINLRNNMDDCVQEKIGCEIKKRRA